MTQHTFILPINGASSGIEFEEKSYKLGAGEVLVGKNNDFPEKKQLGNIISHYEDYILQTHTPQPITPSEALIINLNDIVDEFPLDPFEQTYDKGVTVEFDFHFWCNHLYEPKTGSKFHLSLTANLLLRLTIMRDALQQDYIGYMKEISKGGHYVIYDSDSSPYSGVILENELWDVQVDPEPIPFTYDLMNNTEVKRLRIQNTLQSAAFNVNPVYQLFCKYKMKAFEFSTNDYTYEAGK